MKTPWKQYRKNDELDKHILEVLKMHLRFYESEDLDDFFYLAKPEDLKKIKNLLLSLVDEFVTNYLKGHRNCFLVIDELKDSLD